MIYYTFPFSDMKQVYAELDKTADQYMVPNNAVYNHAFARHALEFMLIRHNTPAEYSLIYSSGASNSWVRIVVKHRKEAPQDTEPNTSEDLHIYEWCIVCETLIRLNLFSWATPEDEVRFLLNKLENLSFIISVKKS